jgi:hypothetical protein
MIPVVNPLSGEITEVAEPSSLDEVNRQIAAFVHGLGVINTELAAKRRELSRLAVEFKARHAALVLSSHRGESRQRDAEATVSLYQGDGSLGERKDTLEIEVRILQERGHDYRAAMSALQTAAANLRAESNLRGDAWPT